MDWEQVQLAIERALEEDTGHGDVASAWALPPNAIARGRIVAHEDGILAGIGVAQEVFCRVNALISFSPLRPDGEIMEVGAELATVVGPATSVFTAEMAALNFLGRMSGIATLTRRYVDALQGTHAVALGTRKTVPGLSEVDQWAVEVGGGGGHRARLNDVAFIRSGHVSIAGGVTAAVKRVREFNTELQVMIEVRSWEQLDEALPLEPDRIVLTDMSVADLADAVKWVAGRVPLEASGRISLANVRAIADTGVDFISIAALTQRARSLSTSLDIDAP